MKKALLLLVLILISSIPSVAFSYLAKVNGEPIEVKDFKDAIARFHVYAQMRQKGKPGALTKKNLDKALKNFIDHYLLAQEAQRLGLDKDPDYLNALDYYKRYLSIMAFWQEKFKKIDITDKEIKNYFQEMGTKRHYRQIFTKKRDRAEKALKRLRNGEVFARVARELSEGPYASKGGDLGFIRKGQMVKEWEKAAFSLKPGEFTNIIRTRDGFHIIKLEGIKSPDMKEFERQKANIKRILLKERKKAIRKEWEGLLRKRAKIEINQKLLREVEENIKQIDKRKKVVARVNGEPIYLKDFSPLFKREVAGYKAMKDRWHIKIDPNKLKNKVLNTLIDQKLVEQEALNENFFTKDERLKKRLDSYKRALLIRMFKEKIVAPQINLSENELKDYYKKHKKYYLTPIQYNLRLIKVKSKDSAEEIRDELLSGADFALLARKKSIADSAKRGGEIGWVSERRLPKRVREEIERLEPGEISPVMKKGADYVIVQLKEKKEGQPIPFTEVKERVKSALWREKFNDFLDNYMKKLRKVSRIEIDRNELRMVRKEFGVR